MAETVGKKLAKARLAKGLTIDEAAHATKMRPDKVLALENDDYSRFANNTYAKGFLVIYGRFLRVDVSDQVRLFEAPGRLNVEGYQYLNNAPQPEPERIQRRHRQLRTPSALPLIAFIAFIVVGGFFFYLYVNMKRLGSLDHPSPRPATDEVLDPAALQGRAQSAGTSPTLEAVPTPVVGAAAEPELGGQPAPGAPPAGQPAQNPSTPPEALPPGGEHEVIVQPLKRTWVRIYENSRDSQPIFDGDLYVDARPLKFRGKRFIIEARDRDSIEIRKNGAVVPYRESGVTIE